jgi:hypothetical protein
MLSSDQLQHPHPRQFVPYFPIVVSASRVTLTGEVDTTAGLKGLGIGSQVLLVATYAAEEDITRRRRRRRW